MSNKNRQPKGTPSGGQFSAGSTGEPSLQLSDGSQNGPLPDVGDIRPSGLRVTADTKVVLKADLARLHGMVHSTDPDVRALAPLNHNLTRPMADELGRHDQPLGVRLAVARTGMTGTVRRHQDDPSPTVRAFARAHTYSPDPDGATWGDDAEASRVMGLLGLCEEDFDHPAQQ